MPLDYGKWDALDASDDEDEAAKCPPARSGTEWAENVPSLKTNAVFTNDLETATLSITLPPTVPDRGISVSFAEESTEVRIQGAHAGRQGAVPQTMTVPHLPTVPAESSWKMQRDPAAADPTKRCVLAITLKKRVAALWPDTSFTSPAAKPKPPPPPPEGTRVKTGSLLELVNEGKGSGPVKGIDYYDPTRFEQEGKQLNVFFAVPSFPGAPKLGAKDITVTCDAQRRLTLRVAGVGEVAATMTRQIVPSETQWFFDADEEAKLRAKQPDATDRVVRIELTAVDDDQWEAAFDTAGDNLFTPTAEYMEARLKAERELKAARGGEEAVPQASCGALMTS